MDYRISETVLNELLGVLAKLPFENVHQLFAKVREDVKPLSSDEVIQTIEQSIQPQIVEAQE